MKANFTRSLLFRIFPYFFFQAEDGIRDDLVTGVQTCALPISRLNSSHDQISYAVFCLKKKKTEISRVCQIYFNWQTENFAEYAEPELYYAAHRDEIQQKGYSLVPSRYIEFIDRDTEIDYKSALTEMSHKFDELKKRWDANEAELVNAFKILGYGKE